MADEAPVGPLGRFPNTRLRSGMHFTDATTSANANTNTSNNNNADPDTCRICRGEGTPEEPLYYPCRCSGSIKHVHQDCLLEWLSHSQKKYCELCKTPFRFTKLYDPNMPKTLPIHVFIGHTATYLAKGVLFYLRAALVIVVWLGGLPFLMRYMWSLYFWLSDEGFSANMFRSAKHHIPPLGHITGQHVGVCFPDQDPARQLLTNTSCPATDLPTPGTASLTGGAWAVDQAYDIKSPWATVFGLLFKSPNTSAPAAVNLTAPSPAPGSSTLLSGVKFLRNLTRNPWINERVIQILEGQIVTIVVIICFILIILVRDYVVQQQPEINMRAAFAAAENVELPQQEPALDPNEPDGINDEAGNDAVEAQDLVPEPQSGGELPRNDTDELQWERRSGHSPLTAEDYDDPLAGSHRDGGAASTAERQPPPPLVDEQASSAGGTTDPDGPLTQYLGLYREANGDPQKILDLAGERGLDESLGYWLGLTRSMLDRHQPRPAGYDSDSENVQGTTTSSTPTEFDPEDPRPYFDSKNNELDAAFEAEFFPVAERSGDRKGKGRAMDHTDDIEDSAGGLDSRGLRPRANTDGPKISDAIHPLANNSWSFDNLPQDPPEEVATATDEIPELTGASELSAGDNIFADDFSATPSEDVLHNTEVLDVAEGPSNVATVPVPMPEENVEVDEQPVQAEAPAPAPRRQPVGLVGRVADFMWRNLDEIDPDDLQPPGVLVPLGFGEEEDEMDGDDPADGLGGDDAERDLEVVEAAVAAGLDPEAIEDAEDLEGLLELLGMRGPVAGLFQNAIFCAFLVSVTVCLGIVVPYNIGRLAVWIIANPLRLARILFTMCMVVQDFAMVVVGFASWAVSLFLQGFTTLVRATPASEYLAGASASSWATMTSAINRVGSTFVADLFSFSGGDIVEFSIVSHQALLSLKDYIALAFTALWVPVGFALGGDYVNKTSAAVSEAANITILAFEGLKELPSVVANPNRWVLNLSLPEPTATASLHPELAQWGASDRFWATVIGYVAISILAAIYMRRSPFFTGPTGQEWEASVIEGLNQASGVMKVILIIGIEMLVFPLYCGMLLDLATLPLFDSTTIKSRVLFTMEYPLTSIFVHWFVGTGYMFHFALFVSMCRKIMRKGVLYFIRDPDDPEFHPVRDVLERSVLTQLRKILFSALVYGALVVVCLGGVVWGLATSISRVLPIHYSTHEPVLEFPIDLLFYNFLMPLAFRYFKPTDGLHAMYTWWFRKCARALRVTWFLFGERRIDEEGRLVLSPDSPDANLPWWKKLFLEVDADSKEVQVKRWGDVFLRSPAKPTVMSSDQALLLNSPKSKLVDSGQLIPDGRFVRAPASDQVKMPKGRLVFLDVSDNNELSVNGMTTVAEIYSSDQYQFVYVPPHFRLRVFLFIMFIWVFAAITGVSLTIIPLVFGRWMFKSLIPDHIRTNDIYAFTIGIHVLGLAAYAVFHARSIHHTFTTWLNKAIVAIGDGEAVGRVFQAVVRVAKVAYALFFYYIVFPFLVASLMELYALIPLHELMYSALLQSGKVAEVATSTQLTPPHTVRVLQAWTLGLLYMKLSNKVILSWFRGTRLAAAVLAVFRRGWHDPDLTVLNRGFIVPGLTLWTVAVITPLLSAKLVLDNGLADFLFRTVDGTMLSEQDDLHHAYLVLVSRLSFPLTALAFGAVFGLVSMVGVFRSWKVRIKDEAYLIGERLHNFGVSVQSGTPKGKAGANANGPWRGGRL